MPEYTLPKPKKRSGKSDLSPMDDMEYMRTVSIPVNKEIIDALKVGKKCEVTLKGTITELSSNEREGGSDRNRLEINLTKVSAYPAKTKKDPNKMSPSEYRDYRTYG